MKTVEEYVKEYKITQSKGVFKKIMDSVTGFIVGHANKYSIDEQYRQDLIDEGLFSVGDSVKYFDEERGYKFFTYASTNAVRAMVRYIKQNKLIKPTDPYEAGAFYDEDNYSFQYVIEQEDLMNKIYAWMETIVYMERDIFYSYAIGAENFNSLAKKYNSTPYKIQKIFNEKRDQLKEYLNAT